jgi:glycosyltransferase involved in cell wall biosynthesis
MIAQAVKQVDLFIAPSEFTRNKHFEMGLKIPIVELPYFTSRWERHDTFPRRSTGEVPYFLFVGRLVKIKGLQALLPVFRRYEKAQLWIVGVGDYEPVLRRMAQGSPNIKFLGYQSGERLRILYQQAVASIVPSLWYEVFGLVILEAFSQGTPVIVRNRGAMPKLIDESGGGFVFNTDQELLDAMDRLVGDPDLRQRIGRRGYAALRQKWRADMHIQRYMEIIEQIARPKRDNSGGEVFVAPAYKSI